MDSVISILVVFLFVAMGPIALIAAIMAHRRLGNMERKLGISTWHAAPGSPSRTAATTAAPPPADPIVVKEKQPMPRPAPLPPRQEQFEAHSKPKPKPKPSTPRDIESILGSQWLTWAGILALFFGTAFFLGVDLGQNMLSGLPQVLLGMAVAGAFLFIGHRLCNRRERFLGLGLLGGGIALLFLGFFALSGFHHLVPALVVLPMLFVVATIGATIALKQNSLTVAALTLVGAILTPIILVSLAKDTSTYDAILPYLVAVNLGAVLVGVRQGWAGLPLGAFAATLILVTNWWTVQPHRDVWTFLAVTGSWLVYAIAPWLQKPGTRLWSLARAIVLAANGLFFGLFCLAFLEANGPGGQGTALFVLAIVYFSMSSRMKKRHGECEATRLAHITGAALALVAIPVLLDLVWVTVGWTALAGVLIWAGLRERDLWQRVTGLVVLAVGLFRVAFMDLQPLSGPVAGFSPLLNGEFLAGLPALALLGWTYYAYHRYADRLCDSERRWRPWFLLLGVALLCWKLTNELGGYHVWRQYHLQESPQVLWLTMALMWAAYGLAAVLAGGRLRLLALKMCGYVILSMGVITAAFQALAVGADQFPGYRVFGNWPFLQGVVIVCMMAYVAWLLNRPGANLSRYEARLKQPALYAVHFFLLLKISHELFAVISWPDAFTPQEYGHQVWIWMLPLWAVYGLATIELSRRSILNCLLYPGYGLLGIAVVASFFHTMGAATSVIDGYRPLLNQPFLLGLVLTGLLATFAWRLRQSGDHFQPFEFKLRTPAILAPILYFFLKVTVEVAAYFKLGADSEAARMLVKSQLTMSLVWGLYAGLVIWAGFHRRFKPVRLLGMGILGLTIAKLFILDMESLDRGYRIVAFIGLGVLFLVISLLYQRDRKTQKMPEDQIGG